MVDISADDVLQAAIDARSDMKERKATEAEMWLQDFLAGGGKPTQDIYDAAKAVKSKKFPDGFSEGTVDRAKTSLGIKPRKDGFSGQWVWMLPAHEEHHDDVDALGESLEEHQSVSIDQTP